MSNAEHLHSTRQYARARVDLYANKVSGDTPSMVRVRDLSVGGMYLYRLLESEKADTKEFNIEMQLPGQDELIWVGVEVVRRDRQDAHTVGYGVRFSRITAADRKLIENFVRDQPMQLTNSGQRRN